MNIPLIVAGSLAILGAAIHGVGGEVLVVRKLSLEVLPSSAFGGPRTTKLMIHVTWHLTTIAFLTVGSALILSGSVLHGDTARGIGVVAAAVATGFAVIAVGLTAAYTQSPSIPVPKSRSHPTHRHRSAGVVGSSLKNKQRGLAQGPVGGNSIGILEGGDPHVTVILRILDELDAPFSRFQSSMMSSLVSPSM